VTIPMTTRRRIARSILFVFAVCAALVALRFPSVALGQDMGNGMDRSGVLDIRNAEEKRVFAALQCTCGCPREGLDTCPCNFARDFRIEVRAMMAKGMSIEDIKAEWVRQHGSGAMMVPSNEGANRFLYILPLLSIAGMAAFAVTMLLRFRRTAERAEAHAVSTTSASTDRDAYDQKLDDELQRLEDENDE
jgi:cytochrome c-type biogenesis protein CcmH